jgi:hypothetical protein
MFSLGDIVTGLKDPISAFNDWKCKLDHTPQVIK